MLRPSSTTDSASPAPDPGDPKTKLDPLAERDFFGVGKLFTVRDLFEARVHLGHTPRSVDRRMRTFLYGARFDTAVFDLDQTALHLRQALNFVAQVCARGGLVLFACRQPHLTHLVESAAVESGEYAHCRPWSGEHFCAPQSSYGGVVRLPDVVILLHTKEGTK